MYYHCRNLAVLKWRSVKPTMSTYKCIALITMLFQRRRINGDELILHYTQVVTNVFQRRLINWDDRGTGHNSVKKIVHTIPCPIVIAGTVQTPTTNIQFQYQYSFQYNTPQVTRATAEYLTICRWWRYEKSQLPVQILLFQATRCRYIII